MQRSHECVVLDCVRSTPRIGQVSAQVITRRTSGIFQQPLRFYLRDSDVALLFTPAGESGTYRT